MKQLLSLLLLLVSTLAIAGNMTLRIPEAAPSRTVAAAGDTTYLLSDTAFCYHALELDQQGRYYMMLTMARADGQSTAHVQLHMMVLDTMAIGDTESNILIKVAYVLGAGEQYNAVGGDFSLDFVRYDTLSTGVRPYYELRNTILFQNHTPVVCNYSGYVDFFTFWNSTKVKVPYVPENERPQTPLFDPEASRSSRHKELINGTLYIIRRDAEGRLLEAFDLLGREAKL